MKINQLKDSIPWESIKMIIFFTLVLCLASIPKSAIVTDLILMSIIFFSSIMFGWQIHKLDQVIKKKKKKNTLPE